MSVFEGFRGDFVGYFRGLEADNSKSYFEANRARYERDVKAPMATLVTALELEFGPGKVARPNRDIRFSADKAPYKTRIYANSEGGHVGLDARALMAAGGRYMLEPSALPRFREAVAADDSGTELESIVAALANSGYQVGGQELKRVPAPYAQDHARGALLRHKRLFYWRSWEIGPWIADGAEVVARVSAAFRDGRPLEEWFASYAG